MGNTPFGADETTEATLRATLPTSADAAAVSVLIIEDEAAHFELMKRAICKELPDAQVHHAASAEVCLEEVSRIAPDIILVDYLMPGMTGLEFLKAIKRSHRDTPIIMITGQGDEGIAVQAMKLGAQDYLVKSAEFFLLLPAVITQATRERRLRANLRRVARLNELLLDSLPYPAVMVGPDRSALAANRISLQAGVRVGEPCCGLAGIAPQTVGRRRDASGCAFCRVADVFATGEAIHLPEVTIGDRIWDVWWIPVDRDICLCYAIDITERKRAEYALHASSQFIELANRHPDMRTLLEAFAEALMKLTACRIAAVWIVDPEGGEPWVVSEGCDAQLLASLCADPLRADAGGEQSLAPPSDAYPSTHLEPILSGERHLGAVYLADPLENRLTPEKAKIVATAAMELATAVERILSKEQLKRSEQTLRFLSNRLLTAQEEERSRLAQELHDSIGSSLCAVRLSAQNILQGKLPLKALDNVVSLTQGVIDEVRHIVTDLRPSVLDHLGIIAALRWFCRQYLDIHPDVELEAHLDIAEQEVPEPLKIVLLRIVQESFNNIAKYSEADRVTLFLSKRDGKLRLCIEDNGIGFSPPSTAPAGSAGTGIGLMSMKERTELCGGTFALTSRKGHGTRITIRIPIETRGERHE